MPALDLRPPALNLAYYPGNPITLNFSFPAGYLAGTTFNTYMNGRGDGGIEGTCTEDGDTLIVEFTEDQTATFAFQVNWELDLFTAPNIYTPMVIGVWTPGTDSQVPLSDSYTITIAPEVTVEVSGPNLPGPQGAAGAPGAPGTPGADGVVMTVVAGTGIDVDATDPANPIVSAEITVTDVTGTSDTIAAGDLGKILRYTDSGLVTVTLPDAIAVGSMVNLLFWGAAGGAVQDNGTSTVQVEGAVAQYGEVSCVVVATNTWSVVGAIS